MVEEEAGLSDIAGLRMQNGMIQLGVMNNLSTFPLLTGPTKETP